jgi:hypothetical protein
MLMKRFVPASPVVLCSRLRREGHLQGETSGVGQATAVVGAVSDRRRRGRGSGFGRCGARCARVEGSAVFADSQGYCVIGS